MICLHSYIPPSQERMEAHSGGRTSLRGKDIDVTVMSRRCLPAVDAVRSRSTKCRALCRSLVIDRRVTLRHRCNTSAAWDETSGGSGIANMPGHNGIISFLLALAKTDRIGKDVKLKSGRVGQVTILEDLAHYLGLRGGAGIRGRDAKIAAHHQRAFADLFGFTENEECMYALQTEDESAFRAAFTRLRERHKEASHTRSTPRIV